MPKDSGFFEEGYRLCGDSDQNVSQIAQKLYEEMLFQYQTHKLALAGEFNILYFFQAAIRVWQTHHPDVKLQSTIYPCASDPIHATNWPAQSAENHSMANRFVELVNLDSIPSGSTFDIDYAVRIIALAFDSDGTLRKSPSQIASDDCDFDAWLAGFNTEQS